MSCAWTALLNRQGFALELAKPGRNESSTDEEVIQLNH